MTTVNFLDYEPDSFYVLNRRGFFGLSKSPLEKQGLSKENEYYLSFIRYSPVISGIQTTQHVQSPKQIVEEAILNEPSCLVVEPIAMGWGTGPYMRFLDLLAEQKENRAIVIYTKAFYRPDSGKLLDPCERRGLITVSRAYPLVEQEEVEKLVRIIKRECEKYKK